MSLLRGYLIYRLFLLIVGFLIILAVSYVVVGKGLLECLTAKNAYQQQYGADWQEHYLAERLTTPEADQRKAIFGAAGLVTITALCYLVYRQIVPKSSRRRRSRRR